ncbi:MAG: hypothetical protein D6806_13450 [Deltaproteobacteria bacterium]|nr:MAG: hypothetical protein D6806_13450 [Deltaproteobacteria bacterium]
MSDVVQLDAEIFPACKCHGLPEFAIVVIANLVDHEQGPESPKPGAVAIAPFGIELLHLAYEVVWGANVFLVVGHHRQLEQLPEGTVALLVKQHPIECRAKEPVAVLERRWFRHNDDDPEMGAEKEIEHVVGGSRSKVQEEDFSLDLAQLPYHAQLLRVLDVCRAEEILGAADETEPFYTGVHDDLIQLLDAPLYEIAHADRR